MILPQINVKNACALVAKHTARHYNAYIGHGICGHFYSGLILNAINAITASIINGCLTKPVSSFIWIKSNIPVCF